MFHRWQKTAHIRACNAVFYTNKVYAKKLRLGTNCLEKLGSIFDADAMSRLGLVLTQPLQL